MIGKISRIIFFVKDVPATVRFYEDVLGFKTTGIVSPEWTELDCGSCTIALHRSHGTSRKKSISNVKIVFGVSNVTRSKALIQKRGGKMGEIFEFGKIKFCDGKDPAKNVFQISNR